MRLSYPISHRDLNQVHPLHLMFSMSLSKSLALAVDALDLDCKTLFQFRLDRVSVTYIAPEKANTSNKLVNKQKREVFLIPH